MVCDTDWDSLQLVRLKVRGPVARTTIQWLLGWLPLNKPLHRYDDNAFAARASKTKRTVSNAQADES